ncbi:MAG: SDR family NAD(P)-dependent oxidoreductase [Alphaproteobacteria bacterium]|nr:SDR family NAD(P)-dependent oxidoreductase [Alphaproteobacteria bacterium]
MIVFITGATAGFGEAMARRFVAEGARVIATGRRGDRLEALARDLGNRCLPVTVDVTDRAAVLAAVDRLPEDFAEVNVLINNAGLALGLDMAQSADLQDWDTMVATNINGLLYCTRALLPGMCARDRGHIINLGSVAGSYPYPGGNVYGATKAFVHQLSLGLRADVLGQNVRVTSLEPGLAETEFAKVRFKGDLEKAAAPYQGLDPLTADDIADIVYYVAALPARVNINRIEVMPIMQAFSPFAFKRE